MSAELASRLFQFVIYVPGVVLLAFVGWAVRGKLRRFKSSQLF